MSTDDGDQALIHEVVAYNEVVRDLSTRHGSLGIHNQSHLKIYVVVGLARVVSAGSRMSVSCATSTSLQHIASRRIGRSPE